MLPPDYFCNEDLRPETLDPYENQDNEEALSIYQFLSEERKSRLRKRRFVYGALYKNLIGDDYAVIDGRGKGRIEMNVTIKGQRNTTMVTVMDCSDCTDMLDSVVTLGKQLGDIGNSRQNVGDIGELWGLGYRDKAKGAVYVKTKERDLKTAMESVCNHVVADLGKRMPASLES